MGESYPNLLLEISFRMLKSSCFKFLDMFCVKVV